VCARLGALCLGLGLSQRVADAGNLGFEPFGRVAALLELDHGVLDGVPLG
jgi:hypothetical protein